MIVLHGADMARLVVASGSGAGWIVDAWKLRVLLRLTCGLM
jgi:hypothetical protein